MVRFVNLERLNIRWSTVTLLILTLILYLFFNLRTISRVFCQRTRAKPPTMDYYAMKKEDPNVIGHFLR